MFNKERFKNLIKKAQGDRTQREFAKDSGVNRTYISKIINKKLDSPPNPEILKELSKVAQNNVTYQDLMEAAGYLESVLIDEIKSEEEKKIEMIRQAVSDDPELLEMWDSVSARDDLVMLFKQTKDLSPAAIKSIIQFIKAIEDEERD
ncbi:MAG: hypothetical protein AWU54_2248 [Candidatus Frackibacter sp. T328-2]|nr:MAG: hypothetical protein AWU54_2248 [Candidatus Frackibacter sp. T328-2]